MHFDLLLLQSTANPAPHIVNDLPRIITAIGALGTAAFGLVDSTKTLPSGGANRIGFSKIKTTVQSLTPGAPTAGLTQAKIIDTLRANWFNGKGLSDQKAIAKSLIKQALTPANAAGIAAATSVDPAVLASIATKISSATSLSQTESDMYSRFDFVLTALLDEAYQDADQSYTNGTRCLAFVFAIVLAVIGGWALFSESSGNSSLGHYWNTLHMWEAVLVGVLATPLAPIAKDLSSALATAVNTMQSIKK